MHTICRGFTELHREQSPKKWYDTVLLTGHPRQATFPEKPKVQQGQQTDNHRTYFVSSYIRCLERTRYETICFLQGEERES